MLVTIQQWCTFLADSIAARPRGKENTPCLRYSLLFMIRRFVTRSPCNVIWRSVVLWCLFMQNCRDVDAVLCSCWQRVCSVLGFQTAAETGRCPVFQTDKSKQAPHGIPYSTNICWILWYFRQYKVSITSSAQVEYSWTTQQQQPWWNLTSMMMRLII